MVERNKREIRNNEIHNYIPTELNKEITNERTHITKESNTPRTTYINQSRTNDTHT